MVTRFMVPITPQNGQILLKQQQKRIKWTPPRASHRAQKQRNFPTAHCGSCYVDEVGPGAGRVGLVARGTSQVIRKSSPPNLWAGERRLEVEPVAEGHRFNQSCL